MKNYLGILLGLILSIGVHASEFSLGYDKSLLKNEEYKTAFLAYGLALVKWHNENPRILPPYKFDREHSARKSMILIWEELRNNKTVPDSSYLAELLQVCHDGFLKEYIWHFHRKEEWKEPKKLYLGGFKEYRMTKLTGHKPNPINLVSVTKA